MAGSGSATSSPATATATSAQATSATTDAASLSTDVGVSSGSKTTDSVGFKVGMAFVGIAAAAIIAGLVFFVLRRRKRSASQPSNVTILEKDSEGDFKKLPQLPAADEPQELNSRPVQEMPTGYNAAQDEKKAIGNEACELP